MKNCDRHKSGEFDNVEYILNCNIFWLGVIGVINLISGATTAALITLTPAWAFAMIQMTYVKDPHRLTLIDLGGYAHHDNPLVKFADWFFPALTVILIINNIFFR